jgi:hypothetical protein
MTSENGESRRRYAETRMFLGPTLMTNTLFGLALPTHILERKYFPLLSTFN